MQVSVLVFGKETLISLGKSVGKVWGSRVENTDERSTGWIGCVFEDAI